MNYSRNARRARQARNIVHSYKVITSPSIIRRRDIEPLLIKAEQAIRIYKKATGVPVSVLDETGHSIPSFLSDDAVRFCKLCRAHYFDKKRNWAEDEYPCTTMHHGGISAAQRCGGVYIYMCDLGFTFWVSPIFSGGRSSGAVIAGGILGIEREQCIEKIIAMSQGSISAEAAEALLSDIPEKGHDQIKSLAQLLLLCAEHISKGTEDYTDLKKDREKQQALPAKSAASGTYKQEEAADRGYPLDKERMLLAALRRGDNDTSRKILNDIIESLRGSKPDDLHFLQLRAIELVVLLSRAAIRPSSANCSPQDTAILDTNNRYLGRIQDARSIEELTDTLHLIVDRMAGQIFSFQGIRHASALRKAERFIWENYTRKISLRETAGAAGLSAPYFSSIFKQEMGESLSNYLNRLRVERAAALLTESDLSLHEISGACGFEDQSWFSKIFKSYTGVSPGKYREQGAGLTADHAALLCLSKEESYE